MQQVVVRAALAAEAEGTIEKEAGTIRCTTLHVPTRKRVTCCACGMCGPVRLAGACGALLQLKVFCKPGPGCTRLA